MTNIPSNNSHKTLEPNHYNPSQALEAQDSPNSFTSDELPKELVSDQDLATLDTNEQVQEIDQSIEPVSIITIPSSAPTTQKRRVTPKMLIVASGIIAALLGSAIAGNYVRTEQYRKIADAESLLSETCHTATLSDAASLQTAETGWSNAIARLQGITPFPGFGATKAQALRSKYAWCKTNIDATRLFQGAATMSQSARNAVQQSSILSADDWTNHITQLSAAIEHLSLISSSADANGTNSLLIFKAAQNRLKEYQQIRTVAQKRHEVEQNAVQNLNAAKELHQQFEANQNTTDPTDRKQVEATLFSAIDHLKKIPSEGTTISDEAIQTRQTYAQALDTFRNDPARQQLRQLAASFDRLSIALKSGISAKEFGLTLNSTENQLNQLQQASNTRQHPALRYFQAALDDYRLAQRLLSVCAESEDCFTGKLWDNDFYLRDTSPFYRTLVDSYHVDPVRPIGGNWAVRLKSAQEKTAIDVVLEAADGNIKTAKEFIERS